MQLPGRLELPPAVASCALVLLLAVAALVGATVTTTSTAPENGDPATIARDATERAQPRRWDRPPPPVPPTRTRWSGFAFDACRAPDQATMDRWRTSSPFTGVGIYLGGSHRACEQRHLTPRWVDRQMRSGWQLLPIWVGPQASCTGYQHRIDDSPGRFDLYGNARAGGVAAARRAAATARSLGLPPAETIFYDIEGFDTGRPKCKWSALAFLEEWTQELHRRGYRSGVYSHVNAAISLLSRTSSRYVKPDAIWYAWIDRVGEVPPEYVSDAAFMSTSRVHQYLLDTRVEFGGIPMDIDWNYVSLGARKWRNPAGCDERAERVEPRDLKPGARGDLVRLAQCLVLPGDPHPLKTTGLLDQRTVRAVRAFQQRRGLPATGYVDRRTWTSLLARGHEPVLKKGARGDTVRRLQRSLRVAVGDPRISVDGEFDATTARAVRHYRKRLGLEPKDVVTPRVWQALARGKVTRVHRTGPKVKSWRDRRGG